MQCWLLERVITDRKEGCRTISSPVQITFAIIILIEIYLLQFSTWIYFNKLIRIDKG